MPIRSINLTNFKSINELNIEIEKKSQVICFVGENGSSKTSLLSLIVDSIIPNQGISFPDYNPKDGKRFRSISMQEIDVEESHYTFDLKYISNPTTEISYNRAVYKEVKSNNNTNKFNDENWNNVPLNHFHNEKTLPSLNNAKNYLLNNIFLFRPSYRYEPDFLEINQLNENFYFHVSTKKNNSTDYPFPFKVAYSGYDLESLLIELFLDTHIGYKDSANAFAWIPKILNKVTNKDYGSFQISRHPYRQLWSSTKGPIISLSQGELDLLVTLTSIVTRQLYIFNENPNLEEEYKNFTEIPGLVIIDEVDLHLHPKAQENYLKVLTSCFKNIQFLVTTHSPFVIRGLPKESIVVQLPSGNIIEEDFSLMDIDSITNRIFNYDGRFSDDVENDLKLFKQLISNQDKEQNIESLIEIYNKYKTSLPIMNELDTFLSIFSTPNLTNQIMGE